MQNAHHRFNTALFLALFILGLILPGAVASASNKVLVEELDGHVFKEIRNDSMWQLERSKKLRSEGEVQAFLTDLNNGEYQDWRLPTKEELYRLLEIFDWKNNGDVRTKIEGTYWLNDHSENIVAGEWELDDMCGPVRVFYPGKSGYVRAIRP